MQADEEHPSRHAQQDNNNRCRLLTLPSEIRNKIWEYATHGTFFIKIPPYFQTPEACPGLLSVSH